MHFLLVNDDGFSSGYLALLCLAAHQRGHQVTVVAPSAQQSAKSHSFSVFSPLMVRRGEMAGAQNAWLVDGTPVDCTRIGLACLAEKPVDLVISGINQGYNIGLATYVSGTVGAAREAAFMQGRALAVSMEPGTPEDTCSFFADYAIRLAEKLVTYPCPAQGVCNVNAPKVPLRDVRGARVCPISRLMYRDGYERRVSPRGDLYFWLKPMETEDHPDPGTDLDLLSKGWISITFLTPDVCTQDAYADFPLPLQETAR